MKSILYNTLISIMVLLCASFKVVSQSISGDTHVSVGQSVEYSANGGNTLGRSYQWTITGGGTPTYCGLGCNRVDVVWTSNGEVNLTITEPDGTKVEYLPLPVYVCSGANTPTLSNKERCGPGDLTLSIENPSGVYEWYETASGGNPISSGFSGLGSSEVVYTLSGAGDHTLTIRSLSSSRTLYVQSVGACGSSLRTSVTAFIGDVPSRPDAFTTQNTCYNSAMTLTASGANSGESYQWYYNDEIVSSGSSYTTPSLTANRTYQVAKVSADGCAGGRESVTVNIYNELTSGSINGVKTICFNSIAGTLGNSSTPQGGSGSYSYQWQYSNDGTGNWNDVSSATLLTYTPGNLVETRYYRRKVIDNNGCGELYSNIVTINVEDQVIGGSLSEGTEAFSTGSGTLNLSGHSGIIKRWQHRTNDGSWQNIDYTGSFFNYTIATPEIRTYRVEIDNGACEPIYSTQSTVTIYPIPTILLNGPNAIAPGNSTELYTQSGYHSYQWFKEDVLIAGANSMNLIVTEPGAYKLQVNGRADGVTYITEPVIIEEAEVIENINKITTIDFRKAGITQSTVLTDLNYEDYQTSIAYVNGLGAAIQNIVVGASPTGKDIVQPVSFDPFGRRTIQYLPYTTDERIGNYRFNALDEQQSFYQTADKVAHDSHPYAVSLLENSPLNRVIKAGSPGTAWQLDGATVDFDYQVNSLNDDVIIWKLDPQTEELYRPGNYFAGELRKNVTTDEEDHQVVEFINKRGQTILKMVQADELALEWASTYYVYDDFDNLRVVLPPEIVKNIGSSLSTAVVDNELLDKWAFRYKYDGRQRLVEKKVPGADPVHLVYDDRNRLVLTQDGNQRINNQWTYTKYDAFNRPIITGFYSHPNLTRREDVQDIVTVYSRSLANDSDNWFEERQLAESLGYSNRSFPVNVTASDVLTVTYYDHYELPVEFDNTYDFVAESQHTNYFGDVRGQVTATQIRVLGSEQFLKSVTYYDNGYRPIQVLADNIKGVTRATNRYDFTGNIIRVKTTQINAISEYEPLWTDLTGMSVQGDKLIKDASTKWGNGGAASINRLAGNTNGWFEYTEENGTTLDNRKIIGFSTSNVNASHSTIGYGIQLASSGSVVIWRNGSVLHSKSGYSAGDVFRIERRDGQMIFWQNSAELYQMSCDQSEELLVDLAIYHQNAYFSAIRTSFGESTNAPNSDDQIVIKRKFDYDHANRLLSIHHRVNSGPKIILASNEYNELGELVEKNLHSEYGSEQFAQSVDYRYNIRGWLTSINNAQLSVAANNDDSNDYFGMELAYNNMLSGINSDVQFNGNISAVKWSGDVLGNKESGYAYNYDALNRIKGAIYYHNPGFWERQASFEVSNINYDLNGNILSLIRNGATGADMDVLTYNYGTGDNQSNRLLSVTDASNDIEGFNDGNGLGDDYTYDANGNMISDLNKDIISITYNYLNLPDKVKKDGGGKVVYLYDATGVKLSQTVVNGGLEDQTSTTEYIGELIYENDELALIQHEEGRLVPNETEGGYDYQYHLKDHLGNTRLTFTSNPDTFDFEATMETENANNEFVFTKISETRVTFPSAAVSGDEVARLNNVIPVGPTLSLPVQPGEEISMSAYAYFEGGNGYSNTTSLVSFVASLASSFGGINGGTETAQATYNSLDNLFDFIGMQGTSNDNIPAAYLNYILVNENMDYITSGFKQITDAARFSKEYLAFDDIKVTEAGFIICYVSNESNSTNPVYWDDFNVTLKEHAVIQKDDYYPFGMAHQGGFQRINAKENKFKYNGFEEQTDLDWNVYDYQARYYDPAIGRFLNVDPAADLMRRHSPYNYAFDNPIRFIDPDGMMPEDQTGGNTSGDDESVSGCEECDGVLLDELVVNGDKIKETNEVDDGFSFTNSIPLADFGEWISDHPIPDDLAREFGEWLSSKSGSDDWLREFGEWIEAFEKEYGAIETYKDIALVWLPTSAVENGNIIIYGVDFEGNKQTGFTDRYINPAIDIIAHITPLGFIKSGGKLVLKYGIETIESIDEFQDTKETIEILYNRINSWNNKRIEKNRRSRNSGGQTISR